jgi:hypothetical protein
LDLARQLAAAADLLGVCLGTATHSRRHGYRPDARLHVERFFTKTVLGVPVATLCARDRLGKSAVYSSIGVGGRLVRTNARLLGVTPGLLGFAPREALDDDDDLSEAG